ncbi:MAG: RNA-binding protein [Pseudomonadota bacterium]|nr:MAG: RNA-binding protein [Pseudomonadota bacterium]
MGKRLYCGNLPYSATEEEVREIFSEGGRTVVDIHIVLDRDTGRPRGFAFVEMSTDEEAAQAIEELDGRIFQGRALGVKEARERQPRGPGGGGFRGPRPPHRERGSFRGGREPRSDWGDPPPFDPYEVSSGFAGDRRGDRRRGGRDRRRRRDDFDPGW